MSKVNIEFRQGEHYYKTDDGFFTWNRMNNLRGFCNVVLITFQFELMMSQRERISEMNEDRLT